MTPAASAAQSSVAGAAVAAALARTCEAGLIAQEAGDDDTAIACFETAVALAPTLLDVHLLLANVHLARHDRQAARAALRHAVTVAIRHDAAAHQRLGGALVQAAAPEEALACFEAACAAAPQAAAAHAARAAALRALCRLDESWHAAEHARRLAPDDPAVLATAAHVALEHGRLDDADALLARSLALRPSHGVTRTHRAAVRGLRGDLAGALADLEGRERPVPASCATPWHGEPLRGASVLCTADQGAGDRFQFVRYLPHVRACGAGSVVVEAEASIVPLLRANGIDAVPRGAVPATDRHVPLTSLPHVLGLRGDAITGDGTPYLVAGPAHADRLPLPPRDGRPRVGVTWRGNPDFLNDRKRSLPDDAVAALVASVPGVRWISLQQGDGAEAVPPGAERLPRPLTDWQATAQLLTELDALVTIDTGIAHLAGALGTPVHVLLPAVPDWRWGLEGERTPWYGSMRLHRQATAGDWSAGIAGVRDRLLGIGA
jgi:tetratricopeptide (TPR) repeat protein